MLRAVVVSSVLLASSIADAQVAVTVTLNPEGQMLAQQLGITPQELANRIQVRINDAYGASNVDGFLRSFTDATAFSARGLGVDYVSLPRNLILGVGANVAIAASGDYNATERPTAGFAANLAFMAGLNLSDYDYPRWTLFANGFYRNASTSELRGGLASFGFHAQYRLVSQQEDKGTASKFLRWTGIDLTSGIEYTRWSLGVEDDIVTDLTVDGESNSAALVLDSVGTFDLTTNAVNVPVELTTGLRIALLVSLYVGGGVDFTSGKTKLETNLTGTLRTSDGRDVGTTTITGGGENNGSPVAGRVLAGVQLNIWKLKIYTQVNASQVPAASVGVGIRGVL